MKKICCLLLSLIMIISLVSCTFESNKNVSNTSEESSVNTSATELSYDNNANNKPSLNTEAEKMYRAALEDKIYVVDEQLGEVKLKDCRFPSNNLRLGDCEFLSKALLDMNKDGVKELVIQSEDKDHIILHYYDGKVYSYSFDIKNFYNLNTDGTFYWSDNSLSNECLCGLNRIVFDGASLKIEEIYLIKGRPDEINDYYMGGKPVTREEYLNYYQSNCKTRMRFSPLEFSSQYPISSLQAVHIASNYWGFEDGEYDCAAGKTSIHRIVLLSKPSIESRYYRVAWKIETSHHCFDGWEARLPEYTDVYKQLLVDARTGECFEYVESEPDGKGGEPDGKGWEPDGKG